MDMNSQQGKVLRRGLCALLFLFSFPATCMAGPYPIKPGEIGPLAPGNLQYPFLCQTVAAGLGNPFVDNQSERGTPVKDASGKLIGYSEFCGSPMRIDYFYKPKSEDIYLPLPKDETGHYKYPSNLDVTELGDKYIVRVERGTINRFMYAIAILQDPVSGKSPRQSGYKDKAVFYFKGGIGLGYTQASKSAYEIIKDPHKLISEVDPITLGYAVLFTTANATSTQYNLKLALKTAQMVKKQFSAEFGAPRYMIGAGGSGGAIQQYIFGQLALKFLDGIVAVASYPDFITQTIYVSDCSLLEYYFDNLAYDAPTPWSKRQLIEGLAANDNMPTSKLGLDNPKTIKIRHDKLGSDTCINGWEEAGPIVMNPHYGAVAGIDIIKITRPTDWSSWGSESIQWQFGTYPTIDDMTPNTVDNIGVQYGLEALKAGQINKATFFDINKKIGGWKPVEELQPEDNFPFSGPGQSYDGWSSKNATAADAYSQGKVAPRKEGSIHAIQAAEKSGTVFRGDLELPILDIKQDQEASGDMHSLVHSFVTRARLQQYKKSLNQVIWIARLDQEEFWSAIEAMAFSQLQKLKSPINQKPANVALKIMENWVENIKLHPKKTVSDNKPFYLKDSCYYHDKFGPHVLAGDDIWNGIIDPTQKKGECAKHFIIHPTSRMVAGGDFLGNVFKCKLIPVDQFVREKGYGEVTMKDDDINQLKHIFPEGVCAIEKHK
jgi:hypothetical protein